MDQMKQRYAELNKAVDGLTLKINKHQYANEQEKLRLEGMLEQQIYAMTQVEALLIPKDLQHDVLIDRMLNVALGNALLLVIHHSDPICDIICEMEEAGFKAPDTANAYNYLVKTFDKRNVDKFLNKLHPYQKYVISAIDNDPQLYLDHEWVMGEYGEHQLEFEICCQSLGIAYERIRDIIRYATKLPFSQLVEAYECYLAVANQSDQTGIRDVMETVPGPSQEEDE